MNFECPQFVPQEVCLSCNGCCRFKDNKSLWQPKFSADEIYDLRREKPSLYDIIFSKSVIEPDGFVRAVPGDGCAQCHFFTKESNACRIYDARPFECRLYPFILHRKDNKVFLCVHLACPHIQAHWQTQPYEDFVGELKQYLSTESARAWLSANYQSINDYSAFDEELQVIEELPIIKNKPFELLNSRLSIERGLLNQPPEVNGQVFSNIFLWQDYFNFSVENIDGAACVFAHDEGSCFMYLPPLAENISRGLIDRCFSYMDRHNHNKEFPRVEHVSQRQLQFFPEDDFTYYRKSDEYCYYREKIAQLKGSALKSKRHDVNYLLKHCRPQFLPYNISMKQECMALFTLWAATREKKHADLVYLQMLRDNAKVHALALEFAPSVGLIGRVALVDGSIKAYTFGYPLDKNTFCVLLEVADLSVTGLATFVFQQFCQDEALQRYAMINTMDDFGMDNIREAKMAFHPDAMTAVYSVKRKGA